ncbi:OmpA family protein [Rhizobium sp. TRM95796]|uniref:OmpA family protein n=1 Tax=Rhizobium sp. TRM95796 TaxID=2979862 RepID=UPI0021E72D96|nr:OmpA family protein [Rhizobium sp. TRM95796]MCV3765218.1 OmpA family protein [Rhizobium sp. TRM95796]
MALRHKLLATAAIPLIALTGLSPVWAATMPQAVIAAPQSTDVVQVQSEEELLQQKEQRRQERQQRQQEKQQRQQERQQRQQEQEQGQGEQRQKRQQEKQQRQQQEQDQQQDQQRQQEREQRRQERQRQKQEEQQRQNDAETQKEQRRQERKRQQEEQQGQQQEENRKDRKRNNAEAQENRVNEDQSQDKPRKRNNQAEDNAGQADQAEKPRKRNNGSVEEVETQRPRNGQADAGEKNGEPKRLPVKNGAAVLDSEKDADKGDETARERRRRERQEAEPVRAPRSDREAQAGFKDKDGRPIRVRPALEEKGERITGFQGYDLGEGRRLNDRDNRVIIKLGDRVIVRDDDRDRLGRRGDTRYERLANNRVREVVVRPDGVRIVTVRNRYGEIIKRTRVERAGREVVIFYSPILDAGRADRLYLRDPGARLPPMRLSIPVEDYIIDVSKEPNRNYVEFLEEPPVEPVERVYSVDEVKYSARIRDKVRRIDLDTITFDTGSWDISMSQASSLKRVGAAIKQILDEDPGETFLIEGHTDAVGSDESNLVLSDHRAESVAEVLSDMFEIPAENLVTQGYGERYLKINTEEAARENRRVTIRRITPLVRPVAQAE